MDEQMASYGDLKSHQKKFQPMVRGRKVKKDKTLGISVLEAVDFENASASASKIFFKKNSLPLPLPKFFSKKNRFRFRFQIFFQKKFASASASI